MLPYLRLVLGFLLLVSGVFFFTTPVQAIEEGTDLGPANYKAPQNSNYAIQNLEHAVLCELVGTSPLGACIASVKETDGKITPKAFRQVPGMGIAGGMSNVVVAMYDNPPTSTTEYLADVAEGFGVVKPAFAQVGGSGAGIIEPVRTLWQIFRNISYFLFIIVFLAVGFMIMFRKKLNPQTVVSIQSALPGLVIALVLVTFSYFIAALTIDMSFLGVQVGARLFTSDGLTNAFGSEGEIIGLAQDSNAFKLFWEPIKSLPTKTPQIVGGIFETAGSVTGIEGPLSQGIAAAGITGVLGAIVGIIIGGFTLWPVLIGAGAALSIVTLLIPLVLIVALIVQFFKLLLALIKAYITILLMTALGPLFLLFAALPGRGGVFSFWWKQILANALVFPAVFLGFLFAGMILNTNTEAWRTSPPMFGGLSTVLIQVILAYGIILGLPAIPNMVKDALGVKDVRGFAEEAMGGASAGWKRFSGAGRSAYNDTMERRGYFAVQKAAENQRRLRQNRRARTIVAANPRLEGLLRWLPKGR